MRQLLFVDGNAIHRMYTKMVLGLMKIEVDSLSDPSQIVKYVITDKYSIILLDIDELGLMAFEAARDIRQINSAIPVIGVTDVADVSIMFKAIQYGMNSCIQRMNLLETLSDFRQEEEKKVA